MPKFYKHIFSFLLLTLLITSCKKKQEEEILVDLGQDYFPVKVGNYIVYDVDSVAYSLLLHDTIISKYRIKEEIDTLFEDNSGRQTIRLVRYKKNFSATIPYDQMSWKVQDVWMANKTNTTAEVVEENVRFIKLIFPVANAKTWNGNAQNTQPEWKYKYENTDAPLTINKLNFDKTVKVTQRFSSSLIHYQSYVEKYARGVGMIYKEKIDVKSNTISSVPILNRIEEGIVYKMNVVEYQVK